MTRGQVVHTHEDGEHDRDEHGRVAAVAELAAADPAVDVLPAQRDVKEDEGEADVEVRVQVGLDRVALAGGDGAAGHDGQPDGSEEVDQLAHDQALHRWLSTDWWARNRPKVMKLR